MNYFRTDDPCKFRLMPLSHDRIFASVRRRMGDTSDRLGATFYLSLKRTRPERPS